MRTTSRLAGLALVALAGCSAPRQLLIEPRDRLPLPLDAGAAPLRVALGQVTDARPVAERTGRAPGERDRGVPFIGEVEVTRGSQVSGDDDLGDAPIEGLTSTLRRHLRSIEGVEVVEAGAEADYALDVEVLHVVATSFRARRELDVPIVDWFLDPSVEQSFLPMASVVLRLRLRAADGRFEAARVVNAGLLGSPDEADEPGDLVRGAVSAAAHQARQVAASWLRRATAGPDPAPAAGEGGSFLIHAVDVNRTGVVLARVERATGRVLWVERRAGLPLVGAPGVWHLSPFDEHGVMLPPQEYAALSEGLSASFGLRRLDQLAVYRYLGPTAR